MGCTSSKGCCPCCKKEQDKKKKDNAQNNVKKDEKDEKNGEQYKINNPENSVDDGGQDSIQNNKKNENEQQINKSKYQQIENAEESIKNSQQWVDLSVNQKIEEKQKQPNNGVLVQEMEQLDPYQNPAQNIGICFQLEDSEIEYPLVFTTKDQKEDNHVNINNLDVPKDENIKQLLDQYTSFFNKLELFCQLKVEQLEFQAMEFVETGLMRKKKIIYEEIKYLKDNINILVAINKNLETGEDSRQIKVSQDEGMKKNFDAIIVELISLSATNGVNNASMKQISDKLQKMLVWLRYENKFSDELNNQIDQLKFVFNQQK